MPFRNGGLFRSNKLINVYFNAFIFNRNEVKRCIIKQQPLPPISMMQIVFFFFVYLFYYLLFHKSDFPRRRFIAAAWGQKQQTKCNIFSSILIKMSAGIMKCEESVVFLRFSIRLREFILLFSLKWGFVGGNCFAFRANRQMPSSSDENKYYYHQTVETADATKKNNSIRSSSTLEALYFGTKTKLPSINHFPLSSRPRP